ncbi:MAG: hypothetical protein IPI52_13305 [Bacteroidetes bacterium]|nr:hypothetical protein [Bacteroidota bacterium]
MHILLLIGGTSSTIMYDKENVACRAGCPVVACITLPIITSSTIIHQCQLSLMLFMVCAPKSTLRFNADKTATHASNWRTVLETIYTSLISYNFFLIKTNIIFKRFF